MSADDAPLRRCPPDRAPTDSDAAHRAAVADRGLLAQFSAAIAWWAGQRTWRVSSSHTGGGVIEAFEAAVTAEVSADALALALPSGTMALLAALAALGVGPGDRVGVPAADWTVSGAVLRALGAISVPLPVDPVTGLLDPVLLDPAFLNSAQLAGNGLKALIAVHLHGLTCDVPAIRRAVPGVPVVEDAARAWAARYPDGSGIGSAADACAFSFGSAKAPGAGELGCLVTRDLALHRAAVRRTQHPTRQLLAGVPEPCQDQVMTRVAPAAALVGAYVLHEHARAVPALRKAAGTVAGALRAAGLRVLTDPSLHAPGVVAVRAAPHQVLGLLSTAGLEFSAIDSADVTVHPRYPPQQARALRVSELTVISCDRIAAGQRPSLLPSTTSLAGGAVIGGGADG